MQNPIIVALDVPSTQKALKLAEELASVVVLSGKQLFVNGGPDVVRKLRGLGAKIFIDLKFHDIPNTVAKAVQSATDLGVDMLTVHASGGSEMLGAAESAGHEQAAMLRSEPPLVLGVTVLTSMDDANLAELGIDESVQDRVLRLAKLAAGAGLRGLVCSPQEISLIRGELGDGIQLVTPVSGQNQAIQGIKKDDDAGRGRKPSELARYRTPITGAQKPQGGSRSGNSQLD